MGFKLFFLVAYVGYLALCNGNVDVAGTNDSGDEGARHKREVITLDQVLSGTVAVGCSDALRLEEECVALMQDESDKCGTDQDVEAAKAKGTPECLQFIKRKCQSDGMNQVQVDACGESGGTSGRFTAKC